MTRSKPIGSGTVRRAPGWVTLDGVDSGRPVAAAADGTGRTARALRVHGGSRRSALVVGATAALLLTAAYVLLHTHPVLGNRLMGESSTDWPTLRRDPVLPWITSVVWVSEGGQAFVLWLLVVPAALARLVRRLGPGRGLAAAGAAHVLASLGSEGVLGLRHLAGSVPSSALHLLDVGPSYLAVGTVAALVVAERGWARIVAAVVLAGLLGLPQIGLLDGLGRLDVTPLGHLLATLIGAAAAGLADRAPRRGGRLSVRAAPRGADRPAGSR